MGFRPRHAADKKKRNYIPKPLEELTTPVQRLVVLLAIEEQHLLPPPTNHKHSCPRNLKVPAIGSEKSAPSSQGPTDSSHSSAGPTAPNSEAAPSQAGPEQEQQDDLLREAVQLSINHQRIRRPWTCWRCNHRVYLQGRAEQLSDSRPAPQ